MCTCMMRAIALNLICESLLLQFMKHVIHVHSQEAKIILHSNQSTFLKIQLCF